MMGINAREFRPIAVVTLDDLERTLDLSFVRDLVRDHYAAKGRPSVDPAVFFKLQLVMFVEGIRSERQLIAVAEDRLSVRWYLGDNLGEALPDHSSMTRIRQRLGLTVFREFFERILDLCTAAGLVWGREVLVDAFTLSMMSRAYRKTTSSHRTLGSFRTKMIKTTTKKYATIMR